jgi:hypothetical protein
VKLRLAKLLPVKMLPLEAAEPLSFTNSRLKMRLLTKCAIGLEENMRTVGNCGPSRRTEEHE